jgi:hypothetical protein
VETPRKKLTIRTHPKRPRFRFFVSRQEKPGGRLCPCVAYTTFTAAFRALA